MSEEKQLFEIPFPTHLADGKEAGIWMDGWKQGYETQRDKIAAQFFETIANQEMNLSHLNDENERLKKEVQEWKEMYFGAGRQPK